MSETTLQLELDNIQSELADMARQACDHVAVAIEAWVEADTDLAESVKRADTEIDNKEIEIETKCRHLVSVFPLFGEDLRRVVSTLRLIMLFESMGDLASGIAKRVRKLDRLNALVADTEIEQMMAMARDAAESAAQLVASPSLEVAYKIIEGDASLNKINKRIFKRIASAEEMNPTLPDGNEARLHLLLLARTLERIGDIAKHVGEEIVFQLVGESARHS
ncbi:MAG: PhoU domain-containing protein [Planctomycetota bacterium]